VCAQEIVAEKPMREVSDPYQEGGVRPRLILLKGDGFFSAVRKFASPR